MTNSCVETYHLNLTYCVCDIFRRLELVQVSVLIWMVVWSIQFKCRWLLLCNYWKIHEVRAERQFVRLSRNIIDNNAVRENLRDGQQFKRVKRSGTVHPSFHDLVQLALCMRLTPMECSLKRHCSSISRFRRLEIICVYSNSDAIRKHVGAVIYTFLSADRHAS